MSPLPPALLAVCVAAGHLASAATSRSPLAAEDSLKAFELEPGLRIELVAAEPLVVDPVAIAFDERGRMYVAEDRGYPTGPGKGQPPVGMIAMLEDTNGDGQFDKRTEFASGLTYPNGLMCWKGGLYVTCAPDLLYLKDTDGDGQADIRETIFTGFQHQSTTQLRVSHPSLNLDNWVYLTSGLTGAKVKSPGCTDRPTVELSRSDSRFRPDTCELEAAGGTAQFGQTFDRFGRRFICSNRNHIQHVVLQPRHLRRIPELGFGEFAEDIPDHGAACRLYPISANITTAASHTGYFTAACGVWVYEGTALPGTHRGNAFVCDPAGNIVHRDVLRPNGATFTASRASAESEFLASRDDWFRPVNLTSGPDGALYVVDMYRKTIEHPDYLPEGTRKVTDFESGKDMGRIYRIVSDGMPSRLPAMSPNLDALPGPQLVNELTGNPDLWWRMTAHRLLLERKDKATLRPLAQAARRAASPEGRIHALHLLEAMAALTDTQIEAGSRDPHPAVREHAVQLAEPRLMHSPGLARRVIHLAGDDDPRVRFQSALALGGITSPEATSALAKIAARDSGDRWTRTAVLCSTGGQARELLSTLTAAAPPVPTDTAGSLQLFHDIGRILGAGGNQSDLPGNLRSIVAIKGPGIAGKRMPLLAGFSDGLRLRHTDIGGGTSLMQLARDQCPDALESVRAIFADAQTLAENDSAQLQERLHGVGLLSHEDPSVAGPALIRLVNPAQPAEVQVAAVKALRQSASPALAEQLVLRERWLSYTPPVRDAVVAVLMGDPALIQVLVAALDEGGLPSWTISPDRRRQLLSHKNESIRHTATRHFKNAGAGDRMTVYENSKQALALKPDTANGREVFRRTCASCHVFSGEGSAVGPDLTGIRNQPAEAILLHIIVPELEILPTYTAYDIETTDGQTHSGLLSGETPGTVTLRQALGLEQTITRRQIVTMTASPLSMMPQELEDTMTRQELSDLIGFLKGL